MRRRILVTGGHGFIGRHVCALLPSDDVFVPSIEEYDLTRQEDVVRAFDAGKPEIVLHLAADVGGIGYLRGHQSSILANNLRMGANVIEEAARRARKLVCIGTVNAYPRDAAVPFAEDTLFDGLPEENVLGYGISKRTLMLHARLASAQHGLDTISVILDNVYGPGDLFDMEKGRIIPANIVRFSQAAKEGLLEVSAWGTGAPVRDFLYVEDAARAIVHAIGVKGPIEVNFGSGSPVRIKDVVEAIARLTGFGGEVAWDVSKPDGQAQRYMDSSRAMGLGFPDTTPLEEGLRRTIEWYRAHR